MSVVDRRRKEQQKQKAAKKAAMAQPGYQSRYHLRKEARKRDVPMSSRAAPWWMRDRAFMESLHNPPTRQPLIRHAPSEPGLD